MFFFLRALAMLGPLLLLIWGYIYHWLKNLLAFLFPTPEKRGWRWVLFTVLASAALTLATANFLRMWGLALLLFWGFCLVTELACWLVKRLWKNRPAAPKALRYIYRLSLIPALCVALLMGYGWYNMNHIVETRYTYTAQKAITQGYRVVLLTDTHYDTIQDPRVLKDTIGRINALDADLIVLGGDIVEEGTSYQSMREVFGLLGSLNSRFGVYYVYGNHDSQPYTNTPTFTPAQLAQTIADSGIHILEDEYTPVGDDILLVGRSNAAWGNVNPRPSVNQILADTDRDKLIIVADHQPVEAAANAAAGADLQLSGHTHAGQIWPAGVVNTLAGGLNYGRYEQDGCTVIVSSGVAGWSYPIRTGEHCEYVVVDIVPGSADG